MTTLEKVKRLENYLAINDSEVDPVVESTIDKLLSRESHRLFDLKIRLADQLQEFEQRYSLKSTEFRRRYEAGELGDEMDFVEWSATVEMLNNIESHLELLRTAEIR